MCCVMCVDGGLIRRESDKACHKCAAERRRPVCKQEGAVQCELCRRRFHSRGGLAVHRCRRKEVVEDGAARGAAGSGVSQGRVEWQNLQQTG